MKYLLVMVASIATILVACDKNTQMDSNDPLIIPVSEGIVNEVSGIADSKSNPGALWVEQDGGNPSELILLSHNAQLQKKIVIKGILNRDWEDLTLATGPDASKNYIYIGEIGDNAAVYNSYAIIRSQNLPLQLTAFYNLISFHSNIRMERMMQRHSWWNQVVWIFISSQNGNQNL